jgi:hypothetical protein
VPSRDLTRELEDTDLPCTPARLRVALLLCSVT